MTYSTPPQDGEYTGLPADEMLEQQTAHLRKLWLGCYLLCHRLHGDGHSTLTDLETIRSSFVSGVTTALEAQQSCYAILGELRGEAQVLIDAGQWKFASQYTVDEYTDELIALSGVASGSTNLGSFTGTTIPNDRTIKQAIQSLETALEAVGGGTTPPLLVEVFNVSGNALSRGTAVYVSGTHATGIPLVEKADANGALTYPSIGLTNETIGNGTKGFVIISGFIGSLDTDSPAWNAGDSLYLSESAGDLSSTRPTGTGTAVQKMAMVTRRDATEGSLIVNGAGRTNDVPNELTTLLGTALSDTDLGTFTGSIISDNVSVKGALQEVETAVETNITQAALLTALGVGSYADDAAAGAAGLANGDVYYDTTNSKLTTR